MWKREMTRLYTVVSLSKVHVHLKRGKKGLQQKRPNLSTNSSYTFGYA